NWIDRLRAGDTAARDGLLACAADRLTRLARKMLGAFPRVRRWEQTEDVMQNAALRLYRTLGDVTPRDAREFFRLAALNIRRELLDLAKHHYGPQGAGAHHASAGDRAADSSGGATAETAAPDLTHEPGRLEAWSEFHRQVEGLPAEEREVFDLLWYQ